MACAESKSPPAAAHCSDPPQPRDLPAPERALAHWPVCGSLRPAADAGLINETWLVGDAERPAAVFQWLNPITHRRIHEDVQAVTARLAEQGLDTPRLIPTKDGELWLDGDSVGPSQNPSRDPLRDPSSRWAKGCWRLWNFIPGVTLHFLETPAQAAAAGDLVGRFHAALSDWRSGWDYEFRAPRRNVHHTPARMAELESAMEECGEHPLVDEARTLGESILDGWRGWQEGGALDLPERACHGDLKISNLRFSSREAPEGVCLLDLDTIGPQTLAAELGDAWRSWCNPAGEDEPAAVRFDFEFFAESARAWAAHVARLDSAPLSGEEVESLVPGIERICLELSARFCTDALRNSYFKENRERFPEVGRHNLVRAASQRRLARLARSERGRCRDLIEELFR